MKHTVPRNGSAPPSAYAVHFRRPVPYDRALQYQQALLDARRVNRVRDTVLFLEHEPVVTLGNRGREQYLLKSREELAAAGIALVHASRGGDVTYHGPGQLVMYPILHLGGSQADAHGYLYNLEETALETAAEFGVAAYRREGKSGAWTDRGKLAAIGFRLKRWITMHGMSFNVSVDLSGFDLIVPCGLVGEPVTSLAGLLGDRVPGMEAVVTSMGTHFSRVCGRVLTWMEADGRETPEDLLARLT